MKKAIFLLLVITGSQALSQSLIPFLKNNGKYIFVDSVDMSPVFKDEFDFLPDIFDEDMCLVVHNGKSKLIDRKGKYFLSNFQDISYYKNKLAIVKLNDKWGIADDKGKMVLECKYSNIYRPSVLNVFIIENDIHGTGIADEFGRLIKTSEKEVVSWSGDDFLKSNKGAFYDKNGNLLSNIKFDQSIEVEDYSEGLFLIKQDGWYGFADKFGNVKIQPIYINADTFSNGLAFVSNEQFGGYIDKNGKAIFKKSGLHYKKEGYGFKEGIGKFNDFYINKMGEVIFNSNDIEPPVSEILNFSEGLAAVVQGSYSLDTSVISQYCSFVDIKGKYLFIPQPCFHSYNGYFHPSKSHPFSSQRLYFSFHNGFAILSKKSKVSNSILYFYVDKRGRFFKEN